MEHKMGKQTETGGGEWAAGRAGFKACIGLWVWG